MKNILKSMLVAVAALGIAHVASAASGSPLKPVILSISAPAVTNGLSLGGTVSFDLNVSGLKVGDSADLPGSPSVSAFNLVLTYDPTILQLDTALFGSAVTSGVGMWVTPTIADTADIQIDLSTPGQIHLYDLSLDTPEDLRSSQAAAFKLANLSFDIIGTGLTSLTWVEQGEQAEDAPYTSLSDETGAGSVAYTVTDGAAVPEPSTYAIMALGLVALLIVQARKRSHVAA